MDKRILSGIFDYFIDISIIDILNDTITSFIYDNENIKEKRKLSYSEYLTSLKDIVKESDINKVIESSSLQKLEEAKLSGNNGISVNYENINGDSYNITYILINNDDSKLIIALTSKSKEKNDDNETRLNTITNIVCDAILKIYNIFEANTSSNLRIDDVETYINSILTNLTSNYRELKEMLTKKAINLSSQADKSIMIVDDDLITRSMLKKIFKDEYNIIEATNGQEAINIIKDNFNKSNYEKTLNIVGMFLDLAMPVIDGFKVLDYMTENNLLSTIPVIIISGDYEKETRNKAYNYNIADMIEKPFDFQIVKHRINNFINLYKSSNSLNRLLINQNSNINNIANNIINAYKYDYKERMEKLSTYLNILASRVMEDYKEYNLDQNKIDKMSLAIKYYDLGIYEIPKKIFNKNTLTDEDKKFIIERVNAGCDILDVIFNNNDDVIYKNYCYEILKYNHEYYNGRGYPYGLKEENIPLSASISAICIDYINLSLKYSHEDTVQKIIDNSGIRYNPKLIDSFKKVTNSFKIEYK